MRFQIKTPVPGKPEAVFARFDAQLLLRLTPPLMRVHILRMDTPMRAGGIVHVKVRILGLIQQEWYNEVSEHVLGPERCHFTDVGVRLPGMFSYWRHCHIVQATADGNSEIVDDIEYRSGNRLVTALIFPLVYLQFWYRRPIYRKFFRRG